MAANKTFLMGTAVFLFAIFAAFPLSAMAQTPEPSLFLHFNESFDYSSVNVNQLLITKYDNRSFPTFDTAQKKFGSASLKLVPSTFSMVSYSTPIQSEPLIGDGDFTLDFWMYPINISDPGDKSVSPIFLKDMYSSRNVYMLLEKNGQVSFPYYYVYDSGKKGATAVVTNPRPVIFDSWNHLVLQRSGNKLNLAINGKLGYWNILADDALPNRVNVFSILSVQFFEVYFDEVRITNGVSLWGDLSNYATFNVLTEETISAVGQISDKDVTGIPSSLLLHFDEATPPYKDSSGNGSQVTAFQNVSLPDSTDTNKKFGSRAVSFNGKKESGQQQAFAVHSSANGNLSFEDKDFTIDFWVFPDKLENGTILFYLEDESGVVNKRLTLFVDSSGFLNLQSGSTSLYTNFYTQFIPSEVKVGQWNHIAIQRKKVGTHSVNVAVNGVIAEWAEVDSVKNSLLSGPFKILGFGWPFLPSVTSNSKAFQGKIDEFRVVKGKALWRTGNYSNFTLPLAPAISVSTITLPDILGGEDVQPETAETPAQPTLPVLAETAISREEKIDTSTVERLVAREMLIKKVNGDRNYTVYFDANDQHISTVFWEEEDNTSEKKLKEFEYDASGGLYREKYYNRDGAETDIISYYPRAEGGGIKQDVKRRQRGGAVIETLSNFDAGGHMTHTQQYRGEELLFAKTFLYDGDNITSDLFYAGVNNWEKNEYEYNGADLSKITNTRRLPTAPNGSTSVIFQTTSLFENGKLKSAKRISAPIEGAANKVEDISYRADGQITLIDIFDFEHNVKTHIPYQEIATDRTAPEYEYAVRIDSASSSRNLPSYTRYKYDAGTLKSKDTVSFLDENVSKFGTVTTYSTKGKKIRETILTYQPSAPGEQLLFSTQTVRYFDDKGREAWKMVLSYRVGAETPYEQVIYNGAGLITMVADIENNNFTSKKWYYGSETANADNQWFEVNYLYGRDAPLIMEHYYVGAGARVLASSGKYRYNGEKKQYELITGSATVDKLAKKELGDAIVSSLSLTTAEELPRIAEAVKKILVQYQDALRALVSLGSTSRREVEPKEMEELYVKFARKAVYAIYSIEYAKWGSDATKGLTDDRALEQVATEWVGIDRETGLQFNGLYIFPGKSRADAAFVDFSEGGLADSISKAGSYEDLKNKIENPQKREKWDAEYRDYAYKKNTDGKLVLYNEGSGGYLTVDELTKKDPSIMLLVDRLFADMETKGAILSGSDEKETIKKVYEYFFNKSLFTYIPDLGDTVQTVGETFARGGGDCEDFAVVILSILREVFHRLGNDEIQDRLGLAIGTVSEFASISDTNKGVGHGGVKYDASAGGASYYIEPSYLFLGAGSGRTLNREGILTALSLADGKQTGQTTTVQEHSWYFAWVLSNAIQGTAIEYNGASEFVQTSSTEIPLVSNSSKKVASIPSYIEPYDANVNDLANYFIRYIPDMDAHSPEFIAEYLHSEFAKLTEYKPEGETDDEWKRVSGAQGTLAGIVATPVNPILSTNGALSGSKITGDCEDLAFAEASVLQNILTKYYMRRGYTAYNAAAKAQSQVFLLAERNYKGDTTKDPHLYVAFVSEPRGASEGEIMILDPQDGSITPSLPFEIVLNDKYLFYANSSKVSAISFYDWSALRLSAAVTGASTLQQAIDAVSGVRPATDFKFSERAQEYITDLQKNARDAAGLPDALTEARNAATAAQMEADNAPRETALDIMLANDKQSVASQKALIAAGLEVVESVPPKEVPDFPQKTASAVAKFLKGVAKAVSNLIGTVIPGYGAPPLPPAGRTYSGEPVQLPNSQDFQPDPNFDYSSAVGEQAAFDPFPSYPSDKDIPWLVILGSETPAGEVAVFDFSAPNVDTVILIPSWEPFKSEIKFPEFNLFSQPSYQCKSQYPVCSRDYDGYLKSYTLAKGPAAEPPEDAHWWREGACSTAEFSCDQRVYYMGWECNEGFVSARNPRTNEYSCVRITPLTARPTPPLICGPTKGLLNTEYEYEFTSSDPDDDRLFYALNWNGEKFSDGNFFKWDKFLPDITATDLYVPSGTTLKTGIFWSTAGNKTVRAKAVDINNAESCLNAPSAAACAARDYPSELSVTIGTSDFSVSGAVGACSVGPADGVVTVNWAPANANTLASDGFYLYKKLAGEDDAAFTRVIDTPLGGAARSFTATGLEAGREYVFAVAPFVSNNCGGTFTLATTTAEAVTPVRCAMPDLTANAPALSDQYGNATGGENGNVLGAGEITIRGTINNIGEAGTANGSFENRFDDRVGSVSGSAPGPWYSLQTIPLVNTSALPAHSENIEVQTHSWTGGIGAWDFQLVADTDALTAINEENETNNISAPISVNIVDFTTTLAANPTTALAGDTIAFTASAVRQGNVEDPQAVAFSNPVCGDGGTMVSPLTASTENDTSASFSCTYGTPGTKTATVLATYYKIPKIASANVTITLSSSTVTPTVRACAATAVDAGKVTLNWLDVSGEEGYRIYKWDTNNTSVLPPPDSTVSADVTTQTITGLTPGSRYYFKVASYSAGVESLSSVVSSLASEQCPDLIVEPGSIEMLDSAGNVLNPPTAIAPLSGNSSVSFRAKIRNQGGATAETFRNQFSVDENLSDRFYRLSQPQLDGLGAGALSAFRPSDLWTVSSTSVGSYTLEVCADRPPAPKGVIDETPNETNNCRTLDFDVLPALTVNLGGRRAGSADSYRDTVIIDYREAANLKWKTTGNPPTCSGVSGTDDAGTFSPPSPGGEKVTPSLIPSPEKLFKFIYQVTCSR